MKNQSIVLSRVRNLIKECKKELIHFVFPSYCVHCREIETSQLFCSSCKEFIQRFPVDECEPHKAVAVEKEGVALSLLRESRGALSQEVLSTMAAFMVIQMIDLKWPMANLIIPSPKDPINILLAKELSQVFQVPIKNCLKTETEWKRPGVFSDQIILVVSLTLSFSSSLEILEEAAPLEVFQIGFCKSETFF